MKPAVKFLLALLAFSVGAQQETEGRDARFSPSRYYVGDYVLLQVRFDVPAGSVLRIPVYEESDWLIIDSIHLDQKENEAIASVRFRAFLPGARAISLDFGDIKLKPLPIYVNSLLEDGARQTPASYGPTALKGTQALASALAFLVLLAPAFVFFALRFGKLAHRAIKAKNRSPHKRFIKETNKLAKNSALNGKIFYAKLFKGFRVYLAEALHMEEFKSATGARLAELLHCYYTKEQSAEALKVFQTGDLTRFGAKPASLEEKEQALAIFCLLAKELDKKRGAYAAF